MRRVGVEPREARKVFEVNVFRGWITKLGGVPAQDAGQFPLGRGDLEAAVVTEGGNTTTGC